MDQSFQAFNNYFFTRHGRFLAKEIKKNLQLILPSLPGERLLQLGIEEHSDWLHSSKIDKKIVLLPYKDTQQCSAHTSMYDLPLTTHSIDVALCPFTLEILDNELSFISEVDRVLTENGLIVFIGVNPVSLWGAARFIGSPAFYGKHYLSFSRANRVINLCLNFGYRLKHLSRFCYWPPCVKHDSSRRFFEAMGKMILPFPANFYLLVMHKETFQPITPTWSIQSALASNNQLTQ